MDLNVRLVLQRDFLKALLKFQTLRIVVQLSQRKTNVLEFQSYRNLVISFMSNGHLFHKMLKASIAFLGKSFKANCNHFQNDFISFMENSKFCFWLSGANNYMAYFFWIQSGFVSSGWNNLLPILVYILIKHQTFSANFQNYANFNGFRWLKVFHTNLNSKTLNSKRKIFVVLKFHFLRVN